MRNPYSGNNFFEFFITLGTRLVEFCRGESLVLQIDELQLLTLVFIALSTSLIGTFLWLKKMTMLANAISHTILAGIASIFLMMRFFDPSSFQLFESLPPEGHVIASSLIAALLTVFATQFLRSVMHFKEDVAIGIVFTFLFSAGVILITLYSKNAHIGAELLMGNADILVVQDLQVQVQLFFINALFILLFYRALATSCFDSLFAKLSGFYPHIINYVLLAFVAVTCVASFRAVGVMLVLIFLVIPPLFARRFMNRLSPLLFLSGAFGAAVVGVGVALSRHLFSVHQLAVSTSALIAILMCLSYLLVLLIRRRA